MFADLQRAVNDKRAWGVREHYNRATALTRRGASDAERQVLQNARVFLQEKNHQPAPDTEARRREALRRVGAQPRPGAVQWRRPATRLERARSQEQAAVTRVQRLVSDLKQTHMSSRRREARLRELQEAVSDADAALTGTQPAADPQAEGGGSRSREAAALASGAADCCGSTGENARLGGAAVRGALKRFAHAQQPSPGPL
ncbi:hypothetical protein ACQPXT_40495 [Streptomyces sp. CA-100214]